MRNYLKNDDAQKNKRKDARRFPLVENVFYDFVDEFRRYKDLKMIGEPFEMSDEKIDALLASTVEKLCGELQIEIPRWIKNIPASKEPYFVSGLENLKASLIVECPLEFKIRNVFVSESFLFRV